MQNPNWSTVTENELWEYVAWHLSAKDIDSVLVGGAVVSIYSNGIYKSGDIDIVYTSYNSSIWETIQIVMKNLGFKKVTRHFVHPECNHLFVEYASPPLSIGEDYQIVPSTKEVSGKTIKILSPTDCIKDRLASYIYFNARECLEQALIVGKRQPFDLKEIKRWCDSEGGKAKPVFEEFKSLYKEIS
ncbi:hypothetical protein LEP1GSC047_3113 [Leptospira inadai serovar Lyme str. 10]|uniref:Nucleotidyltransferase family protein n=2 Tax=Leptospira inadai serovar Lyme TaxID=293084 RepID=V6HCB1_9LEPT|nr:hypothetical protein [Leptospira inadai]EQA36453.1 hypothetical protein LEP1GSC047_3113 [Leptospira inadai serovar Lyme str. 10]PNV74623.1 hypothetical protein BES34_012855 [Leptospira inadai serovar Lyme]